MSGKERYMTQTMEFRLDKADEYLKEAELVHREKIGNLPVLANLYHAMMNCLFALLNLERPEGILHSDIIDRFKREFVQPGTFDSTFSDALDFAFHITHECNCDQMEPPRDRDIERLFPVARELVRRTGGYLEKI